MDDWLEVFSICDICSYKCTDDSSLKDHLRVVHHICHLCNLICENESSLKNHQTKVHHVCDINTCKKPFSSEKALKDHRRKVHHIYTGKATIRCVYEKCKDMFHKREDLINHLTLIHDFQIVKQSFKFLTLKSFYDWKYELEYDSNDRYVKSHGDKLIFDCHRTGFDKTNKGPRNRPMKCKGSYKINGHCISQIVVHQIKDEYHADFVATHTGHESEVKHAFLDQKTKGIIYGLLLSGLDPKKIVSKLRSNDEMVRS